MDTFVTIEVWDGIVGAWHRLSPEPKGLTEAMKLVQGFTAADLAERGEHGVYRVIETKIISIWEGGTEIAPTEKLRHRGCTL